MDIHEAVKVLNARQHRGCPEWKIKGGLVVGSKDCPEFTPQEAKAIARWNPAMDQVTTGGAMTRQVSRFAFRGLQCEVWLNSARGLWEGRHLGHTPALQWHDAGFAKTQGGAEDKCKDAVARYWATVENKADRAKLPVHIIDAPEALHV